MKPFVDFFIIDQQVNIPSVCNNNVNHTEVNAVT